MRLKFALTLPVCIFTSACLSLDEGQEKIISHLSTSQTYAEACFDEGAPQGYDLEVIASWETCAEIESAPPVEDPCAVSWEGDLNGDQSVETADLDILINKWGTSGEGDYNADLNGDGIVDGADLGILLGQWLICPEDDGPPCQGLGCGSIGT